MSKLITIPGDCTEYQFTEGYVHMQCPGETYVWLKITSDNDLSLQVGDMRDIAVNGITHRLKCSSVQHLVDVRKDIRRYDYQFIKVQEL